ncbi:MAG: hypothetical protein CMF41_07090 [Legionellales bacterium]|nr:hypothetical protein [Legionellales bacterium]OUX63561.1 MAG: hypothetical protein CBE41_04715 [Gammaproteobacteria bacterium TMED281]|tara:strand:+ start:2870 stop:3292 length:423 start_codon:yes stop_codon:yes gene_type:complete
MDILLGIVILILTFFVNFMLFQIFKKNLTHVVQLILLVILLLGISISISYIFGKDVVNYLINGLAVGMGIGLNPLFKNIISGMVFDGTRITGVIECNGVKGEIKRVGLLHTWILDDNGKLVMLNNDILSEKPVTLHSCKF